MKALFVLILGGLSIIILTVVSTVTLASAKPFASKWTAVAGKPNNGILSYDLSDVDFNDPGAYTVHLTLANGKSLNVAIFVPSETPYGNCYPIYADESIDDTICNHRTSDDHIQWFSAIKFQQLVGKPDAAVDSIVEFK